MHRQWQREAQLKEEEEEETVLILQGGGSLGAYECGVCKVLAKQGIEFDIIGGTSIGAVNAAILAAGKYPRENEKQGGSYYHQYQEPSSKHWDDNNNALDEHDREDNPDSNHSFSDRVKILEDFWLYVAEENFGNWIFPVVSNLLLPQYSSTEETRRIVSSLHSFIIGNSKVAIPRWLIPNTANYFMPWKWPYFYDISPLKNTLAKYVNFSLLGTTADATDLTNTHNNISNNDERRRRKLTEIPRLVVTATDIQNGESRIFDSHTMHIDESTIAGCAGYPLYAISWTESNGRYLWDGSLLRNTALLSIFKASPHRPKKVYLANVFPKVQQEMPSNVLQSVHRARDILFEDKTAEIHDSLLTQISDLFSLSDKMNQFLESDSLSDIIAKSSKSNELQEQISELKKHFSNITTERGTLIKSLVRIQRKEKIHYLYEDADFSKSTIRKLIRQGEEDAEEAIQSSEKR
jgi:NTE family protein